MRQLSWPQAIGWHMRQHRLHRRSPRAEMLRVATEHGGLHAQVMSSAGLIAWCRVSDVHEVDISKALWKDRKLVKTWAMRHTLHLLTVADYWAWIGVASSLPAYVSPSWLRHLQLTPEELQDMASAIGTALLEQTLLRAELAAVVARITGNARFEQLLNQSWGLLLKPPCMRGLLCFAEGEGARSRFSHPAIQLRRPQPAKPRNGLRAIARQFFATYGPATEKDFARWLSLNMATTRQIMASLGHTLEAVEVEGQIAWMIAGDAAEAQHAVPEPSVRLLPSFDPYVFGAGLSPERYLRGGDYKQIYKASAWYAPVLFAQGGFAGVWSMRKPGSKLVVDIQPFRALPAWMRKGAGLEAEMLAHSMDRKLELRIQ